MMTKNNDENNEELTKFLKTQIKSLQKQLTESKINSSNEILLLKTEIKTKEEEFKEIKRILKRKEEEVEKLNSFSDENLVLKEINEKIKGKLSEKDKVLEEMKKSVDEIRKNVLGKAEGLEKENLELKMKLENSVDRIDFRDSSNNVPSDYSTLYSNFINTYNSLHNLNTEHSSLQTKHANVIQQLTSTQQELLQVKSNLSLVLADYEHIKSSHDTMEQVKEEIKGLKDELEWYKSSNKDLSIQLKHLLMPEENNTNLIVYDDLQDLIDKNLKYAKVVKELEKKMNEMENEQNKNVNLNNVAEEYKKQMDELKRDLQKSQEEQQALKRSEGKVKAEFELMNERMEMLKGIKSEMENELQVLREERRRMREDGLKIEGELVRQRNEVDVLRREKMLVEKEFSVLTAKYEIVQEETKKWKEERKEFLKERSQLLQLVQTTNSPSPFQQQNNEKYELLLKDYQLMNLKYEEEKNKIEKELENLREKLKAEGENQVSESVLVENLNLKSQLEGFKKVCSDFEKKIGLLEEERSKMIQEYEENCNTLEENTALMNQMKKEFKEKEEAEKRLNENLKECLSDLKRQKELATEANNNYEAELIRRAKDLETLRNLKESLQALKQEKLELEENVQEKEKLLALEKEKLQKESSSLSQAREEVEERVRVLKQENQALKENLFSNEAYSILKNDLDLLELENQQLQIQNARLEDELVRSRLALADVDKKVQDRQEEFSNELLRESNIALRESAKKAENELEEVKKQVLRLREEEMKYKEEISKLKMEIKYFHDRVELLESDNAKWKKRNEQILLKYNQVDPEQLVQLENDNMRLVSAVEEYHKESTRMKEEIEQIVQLNQSLSHDLDKVNQNYANAVKERDELLGLKNRLEKSVADSKVFEEKAKQFALLETKVADLEREKVDLNERIAKYIAAGKRWKEKSVASDEEVKELQGKIKALEEKMQKSLVDFKAEVDRAKEQENLKSKAKITVMENTIRRLEAHARESKKVEEEAVKLDSSSVLTSSAKRVREDDDSTVAKFKKAAIESQKQDVTMEKEQKIKIESAAPTSNELVVVNASENISIVEDVSMNVYEKTTEQIGSNEDLQAAVETEEPETVTPVVIEPVATVTTPVTGITENDNIEEVESDTPVDESEEPIVIEPTQEVGKTEVVEEEIQPVEDENPFVESEIEDKDIDKFFEMFQDKVEEDEEGELVEEEIPITMSNEDIAVDSAKGDLIELAEQEKEELIEEQKIEESSIIEQPETVTALSVASPVKSIQEVKEVEEPEEGAVTEEEKKPVIVTRTGTKIEKIVFEEPNLRPRPSSGRGRGAVEFLQQVQRGRGGRKSRGKNK